jgi:hypothetical protein
VKLARDRINAKLTGRHLSYIRHLSNGADVRRKLVTTEEPVTGLERAPQTMPAAAAPPVRRPALLVNPKAVLAVAAVAQLRSISSLVRVGYLPDEQYT